MGKAGATIIFNARCKGMVEEAEQEYRATSNNPSEPAKFYINSAHTLDRRMEAYFYFNTSKDQAVSHYIGKPDESRHIWMHNEQAVLSPEWSIHAGAEVSTICLSGEWLVKI